jgi:hypothetical protein
LEQLAACPRGDCRPKRKDDDMNPMLLILLLGSLSLTACARRADDAPLTTDVDRAPALDQVRSGLDRAHRAYATGDARAMTRALLDVVKDESADEVARANAIALADAAFAHGEGRLDTGFEIPAGMTWMRLVFQHAERDGAPSYIAILNGGLEPGVDLRSLELIRVRGGRLLASKSDAIGYFESRTENGKPYFYLHSTSAPFPMESGAYQIQWAYADGRSGSAEVLVPTLNLEALPEILAPARDAIVSSRPAIRWSAPRWVGEKAFGKIVVAAAVTTPLAPNELGTSQRWSFWELGAGRTEAAVGTVGTPTGATLEGGKTYDLAVDYDWRLQYGQLQLGGGARRSQALSVEE